MIFRPVPLPEPWPAECIPTGTVVRIDEKITGEVIEHTDNGPWLVHVRTPEGAYLRFPGNELLTIVKAPPTWYP